MSTTAIAPFEYNANPSRVVFGTGIFRSQLAAELDRLHASKPLFLCTPRTSALINGIDADFDRYARGGDPAQKTTPIKTAGTFAEAAMHTPTTVTERGVALARASGADALVSVGGGSAVGLGKAVAVRTGLPHVAVPTTYAGSEVTPVLGETAGGRKTTRSEAAVLPRAVVYDVALTLALPAGLSAASGVNAVAHAVEALYARNTNPIITLLALEGIKALAAALPAIVADPADTGARRSALYGAWLCGTCLGSVGMALHHKLCHALGGTLGLPHAETHTIVLPHALAYNAAALPAETLRKLADVLPGSEGDPVRGLNVLLGRLGVKRALREVGMEEEDVDRVADVAVEKPYWNPRDVTREGVREVIRRAWAGEEARAV